MHEYSIRSVGGRLIKVIDFFAEEGSRQIPIFQVLFKSVHYSCIVHVFLLHLTILVKCSCKFPESDYIYTDNRYNSLPFLVCDYVLVAIIENGFKCNTFII